MLRAHSAKSSIAHKMPGDAPLDLVRKTSTRLTNQTPDFPLHVAVTGILSVIEDMPQNSAEAVANSSHRCACRTLWRHALRYRELTIQPETKLNDDASVAADSEDARHTCRRESNGGATRAPNGSNAASLPYSAACIRNGVGRAIFKNSFSALEINASWRWTKTVVMRDSASGSS